MNHDESISDQPISGRNQQSVSGINEKSCELQEYVDLEESSKNDASFMPSPIPESKSAKFVCKICNKMYSHNRTLQHHVRKCHPAQKKILFPKKAKFFNFSCENCGKNFNKKYHFTYHKRHKHNESNEAIKSQLVLCAFCNNKIEKKCYIEHLHLVHDFLILSENLQFPSMKDFYEWKENIENITNSKFVLKCGIRISRTYKVRYYSCHRSGYYFTKGKGQRNLKAQGSNKINGFCPASIKVSEQNDDSCSVVYKKTHVGHLNDNCVLSLTSKEQQISANKIAAKIPLDVIFDKVQDSLSESKLQRNHLLDEVQDSLSESQLQRNHLLDEVQDSVAESNPQRIHLVTKEDLHNIQSESNVSTSILDRREILKQKVSSLIDTLSTPEDFETFERLIAPILPTLAAVRNKRKRKSVYLNDANITPPNKKANYKDISTKEKKS